MIKKKILSIIVPIFNVNVNEINYLLDLQNDLEKIDDVEFIVLCDNPKFNYLKNEFDNFHSSLMNIGKYQVVKNAVDNFIVEGIWFKILDPDDKIILSDLILFIEWTKLKIIEDDNFVEKSIKIFNSCISRDGFCSEIRTLESLVNENSIILSKHLRHFNLEAQNQTKGSDVLMSLSTNYFEKEINIYDGPSFYFYNLHNGFSSEAFSNIKWKNDSTLSQSVKLLKILNKYNNNFSLIDPSFYSYRWIHNRMINNNYPLYVRLFYGICTARHLKRSRRKSIGIDKFYWKKIFPFKKVLKLTVLYNIKKRNI